jgi:hypothetical protein
MSEANAAAAEPMLRIRGVETYYGSIAALRGVDLDAILAPAPVPSFMTVST